jgi:hypothetical protein
MKGFYFHALGGQYEIFIKNDYLNCKFDTLCIKNAIQMAIFRDFLFLNQNHEHTL